MVAAQRQTEQQQSQNAIGINDTCIKVPRYRVMHKFWLNAADDFDDKIDAMIHELKAQRMFTQTVRDGIRLVVDLRNKSFDVLFELFPWIDWWLETEIERRVSERIAEQGRAQADLMARMTALEARLAASEQAVTDAPVGPKALNVPQVAGPVFEDDGDELVIKKAKSDGHTSSENFLSSAFSLIQ